MAHLLVSAVLIHGSTVSWWSVTSLTYLVVIGRGTGMLISYPPTGRPRLIRTVVVAGFLRSTRESESQMYKCFNHLPDLGKASQPISLDSRRGGRVSAFDERMCDATFLGGGCVNSFTIYHREFGLRFNIFISRVLSLSLAAIHSLQWSKRRREDR